MFYGHGSDNHNIALHKVRVLKKRWAVEIRLTMSNVFNDSHFYLNGSVDGNIGVISFGQVLHTADPRIGQIAAKPVPLRR